MATKRIAILGGGMASLAAAFELSSTADWKDHFEITVYQRGWRLGGKCASSRVKHNTDGGSCKRIEEHGLHVWFGFYYHAFSMMRKCYTELGQRPYSIDQMFSRRSSTPLMEQVNGTWSIWPIDFPEDAASVEPGTDPGLPTLAEFVGRLLRFVAGQIKQLTLGTPGLQMASGIAVDAWLQQLQGTAPLSKYLSDEVTSQLAADERQFSQALFAVGGITGSVPRSVGDVLDAEERAFIDGLGSGPEKALWAAARAGIDLVPVASLRDKLRHAWILADLTLAIIRGLASADARVGQLGLSALDDRDFRVWLAQHGASDESLSSAPIRALYDLCFAYTDGDSTTFATANFAAGTALRCLLRITMGYHGAVCYAMSAGMGDVVIAPLYQVLRDRGVRFEFFHRIDALEFDAAAPSVKAIRFVRQVKLNKPNEQKPLYEPVKTLADGLMYWPATPDFAQIVNGNVLATKPGIDFESKWSEPWQDENPGVLERGADKGFDIVILGISIGELPRITAQLAARYPAWLRMIKEVCTVQTQSAQLWLKKNLAGIGYPDSVHAPCMVAAPERMDVWSDMSHVIATETWPAAATPQSVQYICGPMPGDFASSADPATPNTAKQAVNAEVQHWLATMSGGPAWHGLQSPRGGFDWDTLVAPAAKVGPGRLDDQHLKANIEPSDRYVLSVAGSTAHRLKPDASPLANLYLAGDWTRNGLDAGCVEAAVMSGIEAARAVRGDDPYAIPGARDNLGSASEKLQAAADTARRFA